MTTYSPQEHHTSGTLLALAQDANPPTTPQQPQPCPACGGTGLSWRGNDDPIPVHRDDCEKQGHLEESTGPSARENAERPAIARQVTTASCAAAPYTGPYPSDLRSAASHEPKQGHVRPRSSSGSSSMASTLREIPSSLQTASRVSTDAYGNTVGRHSRTKPSILH